jgi:hypothetical protein
MNWPQKIIRQRTSVTKTSNIRSRLLLCAAPAFLTIVIAAAGATPAAAQASDAADRCTPDVMRLCSEFIPDADRIVVCLKAKRRQLSPSCMSALTPVGHGEKAKKKKKKMHREG